MQAGINQSFRLLVVIDGEVLVLAFVHSIQKMNALTRMLRCAP